MRRLLPRATLNLLNFRQEGIPFYGLRLGSRSHFCRGFQARLATGLRVELVEALEARGHGKKRLHCFGKLVLESWRCWCIWVHLSLLRGPRTEHLIELILTVGKFAGSTSHALVAQVELADHPSFPVHGNLR